MLKTFALFNLICCLIPTAQAELAYAKSNASCATCLAIEKETQIFAGETRTSAKMNSLAKVTDLMAKLQIKGQSDLVQKHAFYVALNATVEVLDEDFDSTSAVRLLDLRAQSEAAFDFVFWRFPIGQQTRIHQRMQSIKADKIRPHARLPLVKEVEPET